MMRKRYSTLLRILVPAAQLVAGLWALPAAAISYPHSAYNNLDCNKCHYPDIMPPPGFCVTCHDGVAAPLAATHSSANTSTNYGDWEVTCTTCHDPHENWQKKTYGSASYIVSGRSDAGGITENSLRMSGAGWEENSLAGLLLYPKVTIDGYSMFGEPYLTYYSAYPILANTADTITVKGPIDLPYATTGDTDFAVIYGKLIKYTINTPNSGQRAVRLFRPAGANSFADGDTVYDGICEVCHTQTRHHRNDGSAVEQSHNDGTRCTGCHSHANGFGGFDHETAGVVRPVAACMECHGQAGADIVGGVHGGECGRCHLNSFGSGPLVEPLESTLPHGGSCADCHGSLGTIHASIDHAATFASGPVVIFPDSGHDSAGRVGDRPYFDVLVDCGICHAASLPAVHGNDCATCHPTPYDTLGTWERGCQQGGCHSSFHTESTTAHAPFEDTSGATANDCSRCHSNWSVSQANCLNCHSANAPEDATPPVTTANVQPEYLGPAKIGFTIRKGGKVAVGRTFYRLDGGPVTAAGKSLSVTSPGQHQLEFWSTDQHGNTEAAPVNVSFTVVEDATAPVTTSDARAAYSQGALITLTAADESSRGVKATWYQLNDGPAVNGNTVVIPAVAGTVPYTLSFWSEDWAGNVETPQSVSFIVTSGSGTLRLVWGGSDTYGSPCNGDPEANAVWTIRKGGASGAVIASGYGGCPDWSGVEDVAVAAGPVPYFVVVDWWDSYNGFDDQTIFTNVSVTDPGQVVRLNY